jgi:hypothetical protein
MSRPSIFGRSPLSKGSIAALMRSLPLQTSRHENIYRLRLHALAKRDRVKQLRDLDRVAARAA